MKNPKGTFDKSKHYCGPQDSFLSWFIPEKFFGVSFKHACYLHDNGYTCSRRRKEEDRRFLTNMKISARLEYPENVGFVGKVKRSIVIAIAYVYYGAVRSFGWAFK